MKTMNMSNLNFLNMKKLNFGNFNVKRIATLMLVVLLGFSAFQTAQCRVTRDPDYHPSHGVYNHDDQELLDACRFGDLEKVKTLVKQKHADLNVSNPGGWTPLQEAAENGHLNIVKLLIDNGAFLDQADKEGRTALYWSSKTGEAKVVEYLLQKGANPNLTKLNGQSPLHATVIYKQPAVAKVLLQYGANPHQRDLENISPVDMAMLSQQKDLLNVLTAKQSQRAVSKSKK